MKSVITIREKQQKLRCPVCLDLLYVGDLLMSCSHKHAAVHKDCLGMVRTCPTLGCGRSMTVKAKFCKRPKSGMVSGQRSFAPRSKHYDRLYKHYLDAHQSIQIINLPVAFFVFCFGMAILTSKGFMIPLSLVPLIILLAFRESLKARKEEYFEAFGSADEFEDYGLARLDGFSRGPR